MSRLIANLEDRTVTGLMLPYGEQGRTNLGAVTASKGAVTLPDEPGAVVLNLEHSRTAPVGRAVAFDESEGGIEATFKVASTRAGDDLLAEVAEGLRTGLSVELDNPVIRAGHLISGVLTACAAVVSPAFPSAQMVASDAGDLPPTSETTVVDTPDQPALDDDDEDDTEGEEPATTEEEPIVADSTILASAPAGSPLKKFTAAPEAPEAAAPASTLGVYRSLAAAAATGDKRRLTAALDDISQADVFDVTTLPQYIGELWKGKRYIERYAPLVSQATLTGPKVTGWRFVSGKTPKVAAYNGAPNEPYSSEVDTEAVEVNIARIAGGWNIDRIHKDFPTTDFWASFFSAAADSYASVRDGIVLSYLRTSATAITGTTIPSGVAKAAAMIVDGALAMIDVNTPTFAIVGSALYREFLLTRNDDTLTYLSAGLGLEGGSLQGFKIIPSTDANLVGKVLVGSKEAVTLHELPGSPIRVDAEAIATGQYTTALFGYYATFLHDARGLQFVSQPA